MEDNTKAIKEELDKCKDNPYYFATRYLTVNGKPFTTGLREHQFNAMFKALSTRTREQNIVQVPYGA